MRSLRIGLLTHSVNPRGGVVHSLELGNALHELGHSVTVFAPAQAGQVMFRATRCAVDLVPVEASAGMVDMVSSRRAGFARHLAPRLDRFDVLHAQDPIGANALADLCDAGLLGGFIRTVHHLDQFDDARLMQWQERGFRRAGPLLCVSETWRDTLLREHGVEATVVPNGVDLQRFSCGPIDAAPLARHGLHGAPLFLAIGGVEERKNTLRSLQAFIAIRSTHPQAQLAIAGGATLLDHADYSRAFDQCLSRSGLPCDAVKLLGTVDDNDLPALLRAADAVLMPSLREGFGLVVLEALASGTPVVVSRIEPFTSHLAADEHVDRVCWADPLDPSSIADAMRRAIDPGNAHKHALAHRTPDVCERFSWRASALAHEPIYRAFRAVMPKRRRGAVDTIEASNRAETHGVSTGNASHLPLASHS